MVYWFTAAVCMTICITRADIFERAKMIAISLAPSKIGMDEFIGKLLYCSQCLGFWVGFIFHIVHPSYTMVNFIIDPFLSGFVVSTISIGVDRIIYGKHETSPEE